MADDVTFQSTLASPPALTVVATDDVGGVHYQKIKIALGADGAVDTLVDSGQQTMANSIPVAIASNQSELTVALSATDNAVLDEIEADTSNIAQAVARIEDVILTDDTTFTLTSDAVAMVGAVRDDALGTLAAVDGDAVPLRVNADGALWVRHHGDPAFVDDAAFSLGVSRVMVGGAIRDDSLTTLSAAEGDAVPLRVSATGALWVNATGTVAISDGSDTVSVFAPNDDQPNGTLALLTLSRLQVYDGATWDRAPGNATDGALVNLGSNNDVTVTGTVDLGATDNAVLDNIDADLTTIIGHVDGIEGLLTTIDGDTGGILTSVQLIDNVISAVDAVAATSVAMVGAVRDDALAGLAEAEGDAIPLRVDDEGKLWVNAGVVSASSASEYLDDEAFTLTTDSVNMAGAIRADGLNTLAAVEGDAVPLRADSKGALWVRLMADTAGANPIVLFDEDQDAIAFVTTQADDLANTLNSIPVTAFAYGFDGAAWDRIPGTSTDGLLVNLGANNDVTVAGVATAANQATIIGHVDGIEGLLTTIDADTGGILTAVQLLDDSAVVLGTATYTEATSTGLAIGAVRRDADTTLVNTTNEWGPLQMDANGRLKVEAFSGETLPVSLASVPSHAVTNAGTFAVQVDGAALTALQLIDDTVFTDDAGFTAGTSKVSAAGFFADETATDSVDEGDVGAARMTLDRKLITTLQPHTAGGLTIFRSLDIDETEEEVKATAGVLYSVAAFNRTAAPLYLKFYNATAANVTVGSTTPVLTFVVPANADSDGAGFVLEKTYGWTFGTAITVACTTGVADADTGAPGANDCVIDLGYL